MKSWMMTAARRTRLHRWPCSAATWNCAKGHLLFWLPVTDLVRKSILKEGGPPKISSERSQLAPLRCLPPRDVLRSRQVTRVSLVRNDFLISVLKIEQSYEGYVSVVTGLPKFPSTGRKALASIPSTDIHYQGLSVLRGEFVYSGRNLGRDDGSGQNLHLHRRPGGSLRSSLGRIALVQPSASKISGVRRGRSFSFAPQGSPPRNHRHHVGELHIHPAGHGGVEPA